MPQAFKIYRIICTITDKALVSGSDCPHDHLGKPGRPPQWYMRGTWAKTGGGMWRGEDTVRKHLQFLCHDWQRCWGPEKLNWRGHLDRDTWLEPIPNSLDWSRLSSLTVETLHITNYSTVTVSASDFMGVAVPAAA